MSSISSAAEAERQAEKIRQDLTATLTQLKGNLTPSRLASEAASAARARTPLWLRQAIDFAASPSGIGLIGATAASLGVAMAKSRHRRRRRRP